MKTTLISKRLIATLKPREKQYDVRDSSQKRFLIRVNPSGKMNYVCQYKRGRRINVGQVGVISPEQARDKVIKILGQVADGIMPTDANITTQHKTLEKFIIQDYQAWRIAHRKNAADDLRRIKVNFFPEFGNLLLSEITPMRLDKWRTERINNGIKAITVNRDIAILKSVLSKAEEWEIILSNPLEKFKPVKADSTIKVRYLGKEEEQRLRQALKERDEKMKEERAAGNQWRQERDYELLPDLSSCTFADHLHPMALLSVNTGLRQGEIFSLKWDNISFEQAQLTIEGAYAKSGKTRHIPLNTEAVKTLKTWRKQTSSIDFVFPNKDGLAFNNVKKAWNTLLKSAKIKNFRWHDMRHHFASKLVMAGVDLNTVRELLGHADIKMTLRYAHLAPEHKANAVAKLVTEDGTY